MMTYVVKTSAVCTEVDVLVGVGEMPQPPRVE